MIFIYHILGFESLFSSTLFIFFFFIYFFFIAGSLLGLPPGPLLTPSLPWGLKTRHCEKGATRRYQMRMLFAIKRLYSSCHCTVMHSRYMHVACFVYPRGAWCRNSSSSRLPLPCPSRPPHPRDDPTSQVSTFGVGWVFWVTFMSRTYVPLCFFIYLFIYLFI